MLAQKCTGAFIICHNMSIKGARKRPDMRILCRIARESEASRNPLESLQRRTEAGGDCERERSEPQSRPITRQMLFLGLYGKNASKSPQSNGDGAVPYGSFRNMNGKVNEE